MITRQDLIYDGHPILRAVASEVKMPLTDEDKRLMRQMVEFLKKSQNPKMARKFRIREGVGLAAPQIGLDKRIFVVWAEDEGGKQHEYALANPKLVSHSQELTYLPNGEGCLSIKKDIVGIVPRYKRVKLTGYNIDGDFVEIKAKGFISIIFQHEIDHLNGKMFYDYINKANPLMPPIGAEPV